MSIVPISSLSASDVSMLGNNLRGRRRRVGDPEPVNVHRLRRQRFVAAVNRSLAAVGERVAGLHAKPIATA